MTIGHLPGHILIVEDDATLRTMLKIQLERAGYQVRTAADGEEALERIAEALPDLVLLDVIMPKMDGHEVCRRIKQDVTTANVPVIMLTAQADHEDKLRGLRGGANDYITKPFDQDELLERVRNMLQWSMMQREANPLTGLPGNTAIEHEVRNRLALDRPFAFIYVDLDHFKAFNDHYSFRKGDEAIRLTASILTGAISLEGSGTDFVGHVGGDDFVLIADLTCAEAITSAVIEEFDKKVPKLYDVSARERGYIETHDRQGETTRFPIMTITLAIVSVEEGEVQHVGELSRVAAELKAFGKTQERSVAVWNRRRAA